MSAIEETVSHREIENWLCVTRELAHIPEFGVINSIPPNELSTTDTRVLAAAEICGRCTLNDFCRSEVSEWLAGNPTKVRVSTPSVMGGLLLTSEGDKRVASKVEDLGELRAEFKTEINETEAILAVHQKELREAAAHKDMRMMNKLSTVWRERFPAAGVDIESNMSKKTFEVLFDKTGITTYSLLVFANRISSWFHSDFFTHSERHLPSGAGKKLEKQYQFDQGGVEKLLARYDDWRGLQQSWQVSDSDIVHIEPAIEDVERFFAANRTSIPELGNYPLSVAVILLQRYSNEEETLNGQREVRRELLVGEIASYLNFWGLHVGHKQRRLYIKQSPQLKKAQDAIKSRIKGGKCAGLPPDLFIPSDESPLAEERAKKVCAGCSIREECLSVALADKSITGIWGGTNDQERKRLRRQARVKARFTGA